MAMQKSKINRYFELDFLRGFAIAHMILLHLLWDLDYYAILPINAAVQSTNIIVQTMFFSLIGICLSITYNKKIDNPKKQMYTHLVKRGLWIFSLGMIITLVTLIFMPDRPILFGVLHCIGICIILSIPFLRLKQKNLPIAITIICLGLLFGTYNIQNPTALHLLIGLRPTGFWTNTIDYFPLFPWLGVCLLGNVIGNILYTAEKRRFKLPDFSKYLPIRAFSWLGRHSLAIYLFHQPVIAGAITIYMLF